MGNRGKRQRLNQAQRGATQQAPFEALEGLSMEELNSRSDSPTQQAREVFKL